MIISGQRRCQEKKKKEMGGLIDRGNLDLMRVTEEAEQA